MTLWDEMVENNGKLSEYNIFLYHAYTCIMLYSCAFSLYDPWQTHAWREETLGSQNYVTKIYDFETWYSYCACCVYTVVLSLCSCVPIGCLMGTGVNLTSAGPIYTRPELCYNCGGRCPWTKRCQAVSMHCVDEAFVFIIDQGHNCFRCCTWLIKSFQIEFKSKCINKDMHLKMLTCRVYQILAIWFRPQCHDAVSHVIPWKYFPQYWPFFRGIHQ